MNFRQFFSANHWWGKILGGIFGFLLHGPMGALFGILIGNMFDKGLAQHFSKPDWGNHTNRSSIQQLFFEAVFTTMGHIAKADGHISEEEIRMARQMMNELRLGQEQKKKAQEYFQAGKNPDFDLEKILSQLQNACRFNPELLKLFIDIEYRAAQAGGLSELKLQTLDIIFRRLGFAPLREQYRYYEQQSQNYRRQSSSNSRSSGGRADSLQHAYAVLEVAASSNQQEVKKAYRRMISRNHPDKLIAQGLPESMIKLANDKTQQITRAYEQICESKGW